MDTRDDTGARIINRIEELLRSSTLPPETVLNMLRRADASPDSGPVAELERLQNGQRKQD